MKSAFLKAAGVSAWLLAASAPSAWALSVAPPRTEVRLAPGATTKVILTVANPDNVPYDVTLSEKPWFIYADNKKIKVSDWLLLPGKSHFRLKPGKSRDVKIKIHCPKDAVGELMGMVSFAYQGLQTSMITPMISVAVYVEVLGTEKNTGEITILSAGTQNHHFQVGVKIKGTGNVRLHPTGKIHLLNDQGQLVTDYDIPDASPIFPGTSRDYPGKGPDAPPAAGHYTLVADLFSGSLELKAEQGITVKADGDVVLDVKDVKKEMPKP